MVTLQWKSKVSPKVLKSVIQRICMLMMILAIVTLVVLLNQGSFQDYHNRSTLPVQRRPHHFNDFQFLRNKSVVSLSMPNISSVDEILEKSLEDVEPSIHLKGQHKDLFISDAPCEEPAQASCESHLFYSIT